jgi:hypothetical protein
MRKEAAVLNVVGRPPVSSRDVLRKPPLCLANLIDSRTGLHWNTHSEFGSGTRAWVGRTRRSR